MILRHFKIERKGKADGRLFILMTVCLLFLMFKDASAERVARNDLCLSCHGYSTMASFDKGISKSLYVNNDAFKTSPHGKALCIECHPDFEEAPHKKERRRVDCARECHIAENGVDRRYSHKEAADVFANSIHSRIDKDGAPKKNMNLIPDCTGCHGFDHTGKKAAPGEKRLHTLMSKEQVIKVCGGCHSRPEVISKFNLSNVVASYEETFHGKGQRFGRGDMPDCIDCHADPVKGPHFIRGKGVSETPGTANCKTADCHSSAGDKLKGFHVHVSYDRKNYPMEYYVRLFFRVLVAVIVFSLLSIVFLELIRRLFPDFTLFKKKDLDKGPE